ncbi:MAG: hypothetical protein ACW98F_08215 [Candidatus Hodarchaeales archaeon]|jgi:hypothetical protein
MAKPYRPPKVSGEFKRGESGLANVRVNRKKRLIQLIFKETENVFRFKRTKSLAKLTPGKWYIQLNSDETEIWGFRPFTGNFKGKVIEFAAKDGESPAPKVKEYTNKDGHNYTITSFTVLLEILDPEKYVGIVIPYVLRYNFREAEYKGKPCVGLPDRGRHSKALEEFLDITGAWESGPMKWMDNVLPSFEKRILRAEKEFMFIMKDGWIDTLYEIDETTPDDDSWDEVDEPADALVEESIDDEELPWDEE